MTKETALAEPRDIEPSHSPDLGVAHSPIHGFGVFASAPLAAGTILVRLGGRFVSFSEAGVLSSSIVVGEGVLLGGIYTTKHEPAACVNHSCDPSAGFGDAVTIVAAREIRPGEEITVDYAYGGWGLQHPCNCGSERCRGIIVDSDWERPELADRILRWASPFLRRRLIRIRPH
jgi:hypothetical protein